MHPQYPQLGQAGWGEGRRGTDSVCLVHGCMPRPAWLKYLWDEFQLTGNPLLAQLVAVGCPGVLQGSQPHPGGDKPCTDPVPHGHLGQVSDLGF